LHAGSSGGTHPLEVGSWRRARRQGRFNCRCPPLYPVQDTGDGVAYSVMLASTDPTSEPVDGGPSMPRTYRGLVGTPALTDCLWPVMDSQNDVAGGGKGSHALLSSLLAPSGRSLLTGASRPFERSEGPSAPLDSRTGTPRYCTVERSEHVSGALLTSVVGNVRRSESRAGSKRSRVGRPGAAGGRCDRRGNDLESPRSPPVARSTARFARRSHRGVSPCSHPVAARCAPYSAAVLASPGFPERAVGSADRLVPRRRSRHTGLARPVHRDAGCSPGRLWRPFEGDAVLQMHAPSTYPRSCALRIGRNRARGRISDDFSRSRLDPRSAGRRRSPDEHLQVRVVLSARASTDRNEMVPAPTEPPCRLRRLPPGRRRTATQPRLAPATDPPRRRRG